MYNPVMSEKASVVRMTISLPADVYRALKIAAIDNHRPARELIEDCLRSCLAVGVLPANDAPPTPTTPTSTSADAGQAGRAGAREQGQMQGREQQQGQGPRGGG